MEQSIRDITARIGSGDAEGFACFYREWFDFAFAEARRATYRDEQFCLDIVQEAMMRVIRSITPMDTNAQLAAWLRTVVHSCCYDELRRERRRRKREISHAAARDVECDIHAQCSDRLSWLHEQLSNLPAQQARMLTLRFRFGWTLQRIGASLGLKPGAVDGRLSRTIAQLQHSAKERLHDS